MAKLTQKIDRRNKTRHKFKKTSIGSSHNTKHNTYRGQGR